MDSIYYGLALLRSQLVHGALICARAADEAAVEGRLPGGAGLRLVPLADDYAPPLQLLAGIFARKGERQLYDNIHPLNLLWDAFAAYAQHRLAASTQPDSKQGWQAQSLSHGLEVPR